MSLRDTVNRLMGRSVVDLAQEVDDALARLAEAQGVEAGCEQALTLARHDVAQARDTVRAARDALFAQHPELREDPDTVSVYSDHSPDPVATFPVGRAEEVEVDDPDILPNGDHISSLGIDLGVSGAAGDDDLGDDPWREREGNE